MSEEQRTEIFQAEQNDIGKSGASGKSNGRKWGIAGGIVLILLAIIVGITIYNTPANRLSRQLDLGNRYLEEQNYEQAIVEFDKAIAIDPMRADAYLGKAEAYDGLGDTDMAIQTLADGYERTKDEQIQEAWLSAQLGLAHKYLEEQNYEQAIVEFDKANEIDSVSTETYLGKAQAYEELGDIDMASQTLEEGLEHTGNEQIKNRLVECYLSQAEKYTGEKALEIYDRLLDLDNENAQLQSDLGNCLEKYLDLLIEQGLYDEAKALIEKYQDKVSGIDFQTILDEILVRESIDLLFEDKRYDEARALVEEQRNATDDADFQKMLDSIEEQIVLAENSVWVDDLYEKMIAGDIDAVFSIITAPGFLDKCSVFSHEEVVWSRDYTLLTSDKKVVGVYETLDGFSNDGYIAVAFCVHSRSACPNDITTGDYLYEIENGRRQWFIDNKYHHYDGFEWSDGELSEDEVYAIFHVW